jgi:hypothetical protein
MFWPSKPRISRWGTNEPLTCLEIPEPTSTNLFAGADEHPADNERKRRLTVAVDPIHARLCAGPLHRGMSTTDYLARPRAATVRQRTRSNHRIFIVFVEVFPDT